MDRLPKDIVLLVYRYVADNLYSNVKDQYRRDWLDGNYEESSPIHWDDSRNYFRSGYWLVANHRNLLNGMAYHIFKFKDRENNIGPVPINY